VSYRLPAILALLALAALALLNANHNLPFDVSLASTSLAAAEPADDLMLASFYRSIAATGAPIAVKGKVRQPFFSAPGTVLAVADDDIQVYEYSASDKAQREAARVSDDGSTIMTDDAPLHVEWVATPHFFQRDRLIVVYVGDDDEVLDVLKNTLGEPFAGAGRYHGPRVLIP